MSSIYPSRKIALCYFGLPRWNELAVESHLKLLSDSDVDIYCCFWESNSSDECIDYFVEKGAKVKLVSPAVCDGFNLNEYLTFPEVRVDRVYSMFLIREMLLEFLPDNYEYYVVTRPDLYVKSSSPLDFSNIEGVLAPVQGKFRGGLSDTFAVLTKVGLVPYLKTLDYLTRLRLVDILRWNRLGFRGIQHFVTIIKLVIFKRNISIIHPELILKKSLELLKVTIAYHKFSRLVLLREDGGEFAIEEAPRDSALSISGRLKYVKNT